MMLWRNLDLSLMAALLRRLAARHPPKAGAKPPASAGRPAGKATVVALRRRG